VYDGIEHARPEPWNFDVVINSQVSGTEREDIFKKNGCCGWNVEARDHGGRSSVDGPFRVRASFGMYVCLSGQ